MAGKLREVQAVRAGAVRERSKREALLAWPVLRIRVAAAAADIVQVLRRGRVALG